MSDAQHSKSVVRRLTLVCLLAISLAGCRKETSTASAPTSDAAATTRPTRAIHIAAAADLKFALDQIIESFRREHPDIDVRPTYGSSGNFYSQLTNKAPFDLFLSADAGYPRKLAEAGLASKDSFFQYAVGRIVIWARADSKLDVSRRGIAALLDPSVKKIAIANPQHAPYGRAAEAALKANHLWEKVQGKLVLGENIAQTAQFVQSGAADIGIIALSLAEAPQLKTTGDSFLIPPTDYPPLEQGGVILRWTSDLATAQAFRQFLTSPAGQAILSRYGFAPSAPRV